MIRKKYPLVLSILIAVAFSACEKEDDSPFACTQTFQQKVVKGELEIVVEARAISPDLPFYLKLEIPQKGIVAQIAKPSFRRDIDGILYYATVLNCFDPGDLVKVGVYICEGSAPPSDTYELSLRPTDQNYSWAKETIAIGETFEYVVK